MKIYQGGFLLTSKDSISFNMKEEKTKRGLDDIPIEETNYQKFTSKIQEIVGEKEHYTLPHEAHLSYVKLDEYMKTSEFRESSPIEKFALFTDVMFKVEKKNEQQKFRTFG